MVKGIGTDIIEIDRIKKAINSNDKFIDRIFSKEEIIYFKKKKMKLESIAGNFAAKEAISKALGTGIRGFKMSEIEILRDDFGKPIVFLSENIKEILSVGNFLVQVSISHNKTSAIAFAIIEEI